MLISNCIMPMNHADTLVVNRNCVEWLVASYKVAKSGNHKQPPFHCYSYSYAQSRRTATLLHDLNIRTKSRNTFIVLHFYMLPLCSPAQNALRLVFQIQREVWTPQINVSPYFVQITIKRRACMRRPGNTWACLQ